MADENLWQLSATELQRRYRERSLTPVAVVQAVLARMDAVNPRLNAVIARRDDAVLSEAAGGDRALRARLATVGARRHSDRP